MMKKVLSFLKAHWADLFLAAVVVFFVVTVVLDPPGFHFKVSCGVNDVDTQATDIGGGGQ